MAPSTSHALLPESAPPGVNAALERFYRFHAPIYDWTRPFILFGRRSLLRGVSPAPDGMALDVGCGTGYSLVPLARRAARVVGIDSSHAMLARAEGRLRRARALSGAVSFDSRPYGTHSDYEGAADLVLFSYSLSMIPAYERAIARAAADLRPGGRVAVVDFLTANHPLVGWWLRANHVCLGEERLLSLKRHLPQHTVWVRNAGLWRYFLFWGGR